MNFLLGRPGLWACAMLVLGIVIPISPHPRLREDQGCSSKKSWDPSSPKVSHVLVKLRIL